MLIVLPLPANERIELAVAPYPGRKALERLELALAPWPVTDIAVDGRCIGPVSLDSDDGESVPFNQAARNCRTGAVEFTRSMARLAEQHYAGVGETVEELPERAIVDVGQRLGSVRDQPRQHIEFSVEHLSSLPRRLAGQSGLPRAFPRSACR